MGEFSSVVGGVTQTRAKEVITPIVKSPVEMKDLIVTARSASATMVFSDDSMITLSENTKLEIKEFLFKEKSRTGIFSLAIGKLTANVKKYIGGDNVFEVHSPTVAVGVRGTGFEFIEAVKDGNVASSVGNQGMATVTCTEGSLNLSALSATGEIISTAILEAGQVAVIIGGIITISKIGATAVKALASRTTETGAAGIAGGTGTGGMAAGGISAGAATAVTAGTATAATGLSTAAIAVIAIGGAAVIGGAAALAGGGGDSSSSGSSSGGGTEACSDKAGKWAGYISGTMCNGLPTYDPNLIITISANCSCSSCNSQYCHNCSVSGNTYSASHSTDLCVLTATGTISGNTASGTYSSSNGKGNGTWSATKQ